MVTHLEPDILECEVKWALGSITTNKVSRSDGIPAELLKFLKDDAVLSAMSICQQIWKTQQWPQDWKRSVFIPIPKKAKPKKVQTIVQFDSFHMLARLFSKSFKLGFSNTGTENFNMYKLDLEKPEEPEIKLPTSLNHRKIKGIPEKHLLLLIDYAKAFDCVDHNKLCKILKQMGIPDHLTYLLGYPYSASFLPLGFSPGPFLHNPFFHGIDYVLSPEQVGMFLAS